MAKTALLQARIEPALKKQGEKVLRQIGLSNTEFMTMTFRQLVMRQGLPFDARIPNDKTIAAIKEYEQEKRDGTLTTYTSFDEFAQEVSAESDS
ncbi:MAG: type II toxin-antitoxin system RelB/DinJ family antitoxin [Proteobacteria bacterium]|nr:type II toxin-antitoxin system RelB/DinJ family antitoxin [Pseudomonadota bacterium]